MADFALKLCYLSRLSRWLNKHPCQEFNDSKFTRYDLYQLVYEKERLEGGIDYLEFGVAGGDSLKWWIGKNKDPRSRFIGFDTFRGLPEDWDKVPKGTFTTHGELPEIQDKRCSYQVGLFQDTLFDFLEKNTLDRKTIVHIDCDVFSSALFVLTALAPRLKKGDIVIFDELGSIRHPAHEFRAFYNLVSSYRFRYRLIGACNSYYHVAMRLV
jgi:hypothetical protein